MCNDVREISSNEAIRKAINKKSGKYGALQLPLILAINVNALVVETIDEANALYGDENFEFTIGRRGYRFTRANNGAFRGPKGWQNTTISGVWLFKNFNIFNLDIEHSLYLHPKATNPLNKKFYSRLPHTICDFHQQRLIPHSGMSIPEILSLDN